MKYNFNENLQLGFPEGPPPYQIVLRSNSVLVGWSFSALALQSSPLIQRVASWAISPGDVAAQLVHSIQTFLASEVEILSPSEPETCFDVEICRVQNLGVLTSKASKASCFFDNLNLNAAGGLPILQFCNGFLFTGLLGFRNRMVVSYCDQRVSQFMTVLSTRNAPIISYALTRLFGDGNHEF